MEAFDMQTLTNLSRLLRDHGDKILEGSTVLTLTTKSLRDINLAFDQLLSDNVSIYSKSSIEHKSFEVQQGSLGNEDMEFLHDFVQKVLALKVEHGHTTVQDNIDLRKFKSLRYLELKHVPVHFVAGLHDLIISIHTLICWKSICALKEILELSGNVSTNSNWVNLTSVDFSNNNIEKLDYSLSYMPNLVSLNLSHNKLRNTDGIEILDRLGCLNVSFNALKSVPCLNKMSSYSLRALSLRANLLENLNGLGNFVRLKELDVGHNFLVHHRHLRCLSSMPHLIKLWLVGNPLTFHPNHKHLVVFLLNLESLTTQFVLDGRDITSVEIMDAKISRAHSFDINVQRRHGDLLINTSIVDFGLSSHEGRLTPQNSCSIEDSMETLSTSMSVGRGRRTKPKARVVAIQEKHSPEGDNVESKPTLPRAIVNASEDDIQVIPLPTPAEIIEQSHLQTRQEVESYRQQLGESWLVVAPKLHSSTQTPLGSVKTNGLFTLPTTSAYEQRNGVQVTQTYTDGNSDERVGNYDDGDSRIESRLESEDGESTNSFDVNEDCELIMVKRLPTSSVPVHLLLLIKDGLYLLEKDALDGTIKEKLDLRSLNGLERLANQNLKLYFDYSRKDRQTRTYEIEDPHEFDLFISKLMPFIEAATLQVITKGALQCLKCSAEFSKENAKLKLKKREGLNKTLESSAHTNSNLISYQEAELIEALICPNCSSDFLVELDSTSNMPYTSTPLDHGDQPVPGLEALDLTTSPYGSFKSKPSEALLASIYDKGSGRSLRAKSLPKFDQVGVKMAVALSPKMSHRKTASEATATLTNEQEEGTLAKRSGSDITILSNPSTSSIAILATAQPYQQDKFGSSMDSEAVQNINFSSAQCNEKRPKATNKLHNMTTSSSSSDGSTCTMHEKGIYDNTTVFETPLKHNNASATMSDLSDHVSTEGQLNSSLTGCVEREGGLLRFNRYDPTCVDHRLKLHLELLVIGKTEQLDSVLKATILPYSKGSEYPGLIVVSDEKVYFVRSKGIETNSLDSWLVKECCHPLVGLMHCTILLSNQGLRLEFTEGSSNYSYTVFTRDADYCNSFWAHFTEHIRPLCPKVDVNAGAATMLNDIKLYLVDKHSNDGNCNQAAVKLYLLVYQLYEKDAVSVILCGSELYVVKEDFNWRAPAVFGSGTSVKTESPYSLIHRHSIEDLTSIDVCDGVGKQAILHFYDEDTSTASRICLAAETVLSMDTLLNSLKRSWQKVFEVELSVNSIPPSSGLL